MGYYISLCVVVLALVGCGGGGNSGSGAVANGTYNVTRTYVSSLPAPGGTLITDTFQTRLIDQTGDISAKLLALIEGQEDTITNGVRISYKPQGLNLTDEDVEGLRFDDDPFDPGSGFEAWVVNKIDYLTTKYGAAQSAGLAAIP